MKSYLRNVKKYIIINSCRFQRTTANNYFLSQILGSLSKMFHGFVIRSCHRNHKPLLLNGANTMTPLIVMI